MHSFTSIQYTPRAQSKVRSPEERRVDAVNHMKDYIRYGRYKNREDYFKNVMVGE